MDLLATLFGAGAFAIAVYIGIIILIVFCIFIIAARANSIDKQLFDVCNLLKEQNSLIDANNKLIETTNNVLHDNMIVNIAKSKE